MNRVALIAVTAVALSLCAGALQSQSEKDFQSTFTVDKKNLGVKGDNPYFNLTPGFQLSYAHGRETEIVTVLDEIKVIDGIEARVLEDREFDKDGKLLELTRDYHSIDVTTNDVYYLGEDVDVYDKNGKVTSHEGSWLSGVNGAKFGLFIPAKPKVGQRFYQEQAPKIAMDRVEIVSTTESRTVPAGKFTGVLHVLETTPLESGKAEKWYASGVGPIKDGDMELVKYGMKAR
jgi:hypothetical protein